MDSARYHDVLSRAGANSPDYRCPLSSLDRLGAEIGLFSGVIPSPVPCVEPNGKGVRSHARR